MSYMNTLHPRNKLRDVLDLLGVKIDCTETLVNATSLLEVSQEVSDSKSIQAFDNSYETAMEVISLFTIYSSIFPIIETHISDASLRKKLMALYNDVTFRLNAPREDEASDVLEGRRRFFFDFYLPLQISSICNEKSINIDEEVDFVRMYLIRKGRDESVACVTLDGKYGTQDTFNLLYGRMSVKDEDVGVVLNFLFNEVY